jgi:hypothetical protein
VAVIETNIGERKRAMLGAFTVRSKTDREKEYDCSARLNEER